MKTNCDGLLLRENEVSGECSNKVKRISGVLLCYREFTGKSDTAPAIIAFRNRVAEMCKAEVTTEDVVKGSQPSNTLIENSVMLSYLLPLVPSAVSLSPLVVLFFFFSGCFVLALVRDVHKIPSGLLRLVFVTLHITLCLSRHQGF